MNADEAARPVCRRVIYHGRVQGVGFRFTTAHVAKRYAVRGYVRNLSNGTVEAVVTGDDAVVEAFLQAISKQFEGLIDRCEREESTGSETFTGFEIRR